MIDKILNWFFKKGVVKVGTLKEDEIIPIFKSLERKTDAIDLTKMQSLILDKEYSLTTKEAMEIFLREDYLNLTSLAYSIDKNDCDDFAVRLWGRFKEKNKGFAFGLAISFSHAYNFFIDGNKKIWFIEPQSDKIMDLKEIGKNKQYYPIKLVLI